ncbi:MAG: UDP-glucose 4-epimerase GalE, partial [Defluviitaleaceae bacterium]|nr:UDP-glucose 4-epimerase GalE [Defluviitaleaceae bacterium]
LKKLEKDNNSDFYNLGNGEGFSNRQIVDAVEKVSGKKINVQIVGRRSAADPSITLASSKKAISTLGWNPKFTDVEQIVETAYRWHVGHPNGYNA